MDKAKLARTCRWISALIASLISLQMGVNQYGFAETSCGLKDVTRYIEALHSQTVEVTPAYRLKTARDFIAACPGRWEVRDAHLVAARGALDSGQAILAARHYQFARKAGAKPPPQVLMDEMTAQLAAKRFAEAKAARNRAVADWLVALDEKQVATLTVKRVAHGLIYGAAFQDPKTDVQMIWLAVPNGPELPAAIILRRDSQRAAWRSLRRTGGVPDLHVAEFQTCRDRDLILESDGALDPAGLEKQSRRALKAYLKKPETVSVSAPGQPVASCLWMSTMLHVPGTD